VSLRHARVGGGGISDVDAATLGEGRGKGKEGGDSEDEMFA